MGIVDKLKYWFSAVCIQQACKRMKCFWRYRVRDRKYIHLAVVGTASSGKSFLLKDILTSLENMGAIFKSLETTLQPFKDFGTYSPDEFGGDGGTPLYACRQGNHYGAVVKHNNNNKDQYDMDFLNIPGEIFDAPASGMSRLKAYIALRDQLRKAGKVFRIRLWVSKKTTEKVWIVEPVYPADREDKGISSGKALILSFKTWEHIYLDLQSKGFEPVKGSESRIKGAHLLQHFFEYDTDSAIRSIQSWIASGASGNLGFDMTDFTANRYDIAFVFFHYCSMATDIVICDRIYTSDTTSRTELSFGDLTEGLYSFIEDCSESDRLHVYLAFRNVDFLIYPHEMTYKMLNDKTLKELPSEDRHNAIYSLFAYAMQHYIDPRLSVKHEKLAAFLDVPENKVLELGGNVAVTLDGFTSDPDLLMKALMDLVVASKYMKKGAPDLRTHITSRLGDKGHGFRKLLNKTNYKSKKEGTPIGDIIGHVYFSCTPITSKYDVYRNNTTNERSPSEFVKTINGVNYFFSDMNSKVCFGSFQLAMDLLAQHELGNFKVGGLLRIMQNNI